MTTRLVHDLLAASAERHPDRPAVVDGERALTYADLDRRANQLARLLVDEGVAPGDRVGLYLDKSLESLVAIYGILKAGAAYVPLDPTAPPARLASIARNAGIRILATGREKAAAWGRLCGEAATVERLVLLNDPEAAVEAAPVSLLPTAVLEEYDGSSPGVARTGSDLAYILYTSGSTGEPKGVMLSHENARAFVDWSAEEFEIAAGDRLSSHAPLHFDLSVFDLFAAASGAAAVVLVPAHVSVFPVELARWIAREEISVWYSVPSVLNMLVVRGRLAPGDLPRLRTLLFAGEVLPMKYLLRLLELLPHTRFANLYGPTETNVCTWYEVPRPADHIEELPIGKAIADVEVFALDEEGRAVQPGEVGELCVRGPTVMQGYWADAGRTARSFVADAGSDSLAYRTGDLTRQDDEGNFLFLGRRDAQIKSRGYRIELGEVESVLYAHPDVVECTVVAVPDELITNKLKAFVVARGALDEGALIRHCLERLPRYMLPETFEFRSELPRSATGKIARRQLLEEAMSS